jgi:transcriptional regulator with XRE-family HTH domain
LPKIGRHLRELRRRRQLSSRELATRAGISHSTISLLERDQMSPSVDTLGAVVDALGTTLVEFFSGLRSAYSYSPVYRPDEFVEIGNPDEISYRVIGFNQPSRKMQVLIESYKQGADTGDIFSHDAQESGLVLEGRIELTVGVQTYELEVGDGYYFDSNLPHRFRNIGTGVARIISAITPPSY